MMIKRKKKIKNKPWKGHKELVFELSSGWSLEDYIRDRSSRGWKWSEIIKEMNSKIRKLSRSKIIMSGIFTITESNLQKWYGMFGIKSQVKRGKN